MKDAVNSLAEDISLRFKSGNEIPIERVYLRAEEWEIIKGVLNLMSSSQTSGDWVRTNFMGGLATPKLIEAFAGMADTLEKQGGRNGQI